MTEPFLIAVTCFVMASISNFAAKQKYSDVAVYRAAISQRVGYHNMLAANDEDVFQGELLEVISVFFAVLGIVFWIVSAVRKEQCVIQF